LGDRFLMAKPRPPQINLFKKSQPLVAKLKENQRLTPKKGEGKRPLNEGEAAIHRIALEIDQTKYPYLVGQSAGIVMPGIDPKKLEKSLPDSSYAVRLYSISSPSLGFDKKQDSLELLVKRDNVYDSEGHLLHQGSCSNYLCDLPVGSEVQITGPSGKKFLLPLDDFSGNLWLLATGTGIAPFLGMVAEILEHQWIKFHGKIYVNYGAPYSDELVYMNFFESIKSRYSNFYIETAASREERNSIDGGKLYIHHLLQKKQAEVAESIQNGSRFYICGGPKGMENGVISELHRISKSSLNLEEFKKDLEKKEQLFVETY